MKGTKLKGICVEKTVKQKISLVEQNNKKKLKMWYFIRVTK